ncbi:hypothetical protein ACIQC8_03845 [Agrococcus sediminis]|uniref:hypothetical protein n=1 Tax=Agrococcus sediminis TaxID=2599924 RepID=UPI0037FB1699
MAKRRAQRTEPTTGEPERVTVVVCRGGDCGSRRKHHGVDHSAQLQALRSRIDGADVVPSKCLDACERSNVVVVMPGDEGAEAGATPVWIGEVLDDAVTDDIVEWVNAGGPGVAAPPALVEIQEFRPTRQSRQELQPGHALP